MTISIEDYQPPEPVEDLKRVVTLESSAGRIRLSFNDQGLGFRLYDNVDGLGVADVDNTLTPLPTGGAVLRHQRLAEGDTFLPILVKSNSKMARRDLEAKLLAVLVPADGPVWVHVLDPYSGETRSRLAYYKTGLATPEWESPRAALFGVRLEFAEPWWRGVSRGRTIKVAERKKPLITAYRKPAEGKVHRETREPTADDAGSKGDVWFVGESAGEEKLLRTNYAKNPSFEFITPEILSESRYDVSSPVVVGAQNGSRVLQAEVKAHSASPYAYVGQRLLPAAVQAGKWVAFKVSVRSISGSKFFRARFDGAVSSSWTEVVDGSDGQWKDLKLSIQIPSGATRIDALVYAYEDAEVKESPTVGTVFELDSLVACVADTETEALSQVDTYFDGQTKGTRDKLYRLAEDGSSQEVLRPSRFKAKTRYEHDGSGWVKQKQNAAIPFFPVFVYSSVVESVYDVFVEGDYPVWPTWTIQGPGRDVLIRNATTGHQLFIEGQEIFEPLTIETDPKHQDLRSKTWDSGQWWEKLSLDSELFPLSAGVNKIQVTMVGADHRSCLRLGYREMWKGAH